METFGTELLYVSLLCVVVFVGFVLYTHTRTHTHTHIHTFIRLWEPLMKLIVIHFGTASLSNLIFIWLLLKAQGNSN